MTPPAAGPSGGAARFQSLWQRCLLTGAEDQSRQIYQRLADAYAEPQRHYHTLDHIDHCLNMFDQCQSLIENPDAVELSIWFHDAIYLPGASDNEVRSAELYEQLAANGHSAELRQRVNDMIIATLHLDESIEDPDTQIMVDIDLSSFGLPWDEFLRDSKALRRENPVVSDADYYENAKKFQSSLLARKRFYQSDFFYQHLETQARKNIEDYFNYLRQQAEAEN